MTQTLLISLAAAALAMSLSPRTAEAICGDSTSMMHLADDSTGLGALTPAAHSPTLGYSLIASGNELFSYDSVTLNLVDSEGSLGGNIVEAPNPVLLKSGDWAVFVAIDNGTVARINIDSGGNLMMAPEWASNPRLLRRGTCGDDSVRATPAVHLWNYASTDFQNTYTNDVVYVATYYGGSICTGTASTHNRVYALDAETGAPIWIINSTPSFDMDVTTKGGWLDYDNDRLYLGTERTDPLQDSLYSINVRDGTVAWSANAGRIVSTPIVRGDRIYVGTLVGEVKALNRSDGSAIWTADNGFIPTTGQPFVEFRPPYDGHIGVTDIMGRVWVLVDNGGSGDDAWIVRPPTSAKSRVAFDVQHGKAFVGASDGYIYQLNLLSGDAETFRVIDSTPGSIIGHPTFMWEDPATRADIAVIAGSNTGEIKKFCTPWASWVEDSCDNGIDDGDLDSDIDCADSECADDPACMGPFAPPTDPVPPPIYGPPSMSTMHMICSTADDCFTAAPTACSDWSCINSICVGSPVAEGSGCNDGNPDTEGDTCIRGSCVGKSDCERRLDSCLCRNETGGSVMRQLFTREVGWPKYPEDPKSAADSEYVQIQTTAECLPIVKGGSVGVVWIPLFDQKRLPIIEPAVLDLTISGGSGTTIEFYNPKTGEATAGKIGLSSPFLRKSLRTGTYFAYIRIREGAEPTKPSEPWKVVATIKKAADGHTCIDTMEFGEVIEVPIHTAPGGTGGCGFSGNNESRVLELTFSNLDGPVRGVEAIVGPVTDPESFWSDFEEFITNKPPNLSNRVRDGDDGEEDGILVWRDFGNNLTGTNLRTELEMLPTLPVTYICPNLEKDTIYPIAASQRVVNKDCKE